MIKIFKYNKYSYTVNLTFFLAPTVAQEVQMFVCLVKVFLELTIFLFRVSQVSLSPLSQLP